MLLLKAIQDRRVRSLWIGQVFSAMGDEIYRVAFIWLSVQMIGTQTGYLASLQLLASVMMSIFGARLVDHLQSEEAMIRLDFYRAFIVMIPVALHYLNVPSFTILAICSLVLAGLGALFDPVVMETVPKVAAKGEVLKAANGLMSITSRLARVVGPAFVGLLSGFVPMIHFFTLDAITFFVSAYSIHALKIKKGTPKTLPPITFRSFLLTLHQSYSLLRTQPPVFRSLVVKAIAGGAWYLAFAVGFALLTNEINPNDLQAFGFMMSVYGIGNVSAAIYFGNHHRPNPEKMVYGGIIWLGVFFILIPWAPTKFLFLLFVGLSAIGGPWNDLPFVDLVQNHFPSDAISKIFRLRAIAEDGMKFILMVISPLLFEYLTVRQVLLGCGIFILVAGIWGEWERRNVTRLAT